MPMYYVFSAGNGGKGEYVYADSLDKLAAFCAMEGYDHTMPLSSFLEYSAARFEYPETRQDIVWLDGEC